jgi:hypothetical protein
VLLLLLLMLMLMLRVLRSGLLAHEAAVFERARALRFGRGIGRGEVAPLEAGRRANALLGPASIRKVLVVAIPYTSFTPVW